MIGHDAGPGDGSSMRDSSLLPIVAARPNTLRQLGYDERWLQDWLAADPTRLGLGEVAIVG
jgi:hypothetical protein